MSHIRHFSLLLGFGPGILGLVPILANAPTDLDRRLSFFSRVNPFSSVSFSLRDLRMEFRFGELSLLDPFLFSAQQKGNVTKDIKISKKHMQSNLI